MRDGVLHLASDALSPPLRAKFELRKLSDVSSAHSTHATLSVPLS
jgi:hypothetical protein